MINFEHLNYFNNNATTPVDTIVLDVMLPFIKYNFANPSSTHHFGINVNAAVNKARTDVADLIEAEEYEIIFISGATEAINNAIKGVAENYATKGKHILTVSTEHSAVPDTCKHLETKGYEITYLPVLEDGLIDLAKHNNSIREETILVCAMYVNNETGVIQPIKEIASLAHEVGALFMTDTTEAAGKIEIDFDALGIDLLCFCGYKMYAPKGIGALYVRQCIKKAKLPVFIYGGWHERGIRSGTLNVPGIIALTKACEIEQSEMKHDSERVSSLRDEFENELLKIEGSFINDNRKNRIFNTTNIFFLNVDANILIGRIKKIAVSNGSVCTSAVVEPSHVLTAMGLNEDEAFDSLRFSLGRYNTKEEVISATQLIKG